MELNRTLSGYQIDVLSTVYLCFLTPSVIGSLSVLLVSFVRWRHLKEQVQLLVQLALADLLAALVLMVTSTMNKVNTEHSVAICQFSLPLSLTFYFISFLLVVLYAWKSKNLIQGWRVRPADDEGGQSGCQRRIVALPVYAAVWLVPVALYLAYVLTPFISTSVLIPLSGKAPVIEMDGKYCTSCILFLHIWSDSCSDAEFLHDSFIRVFLILVVIPVMLSCSVIYYQVGKWYRQQEQGGLFPVEGDGRSGRGFKRVFATTRNMVVVILFCWTPALLVVLLSTLVIWTDVDQRVLFAVFVLQAATTSLQGFLNSMAYAWRRPNFTKAVLGENTPLVAYKHAAFFEESLPNPS